MSDCSGERKVSEVIKNADLYDLIKISLKTSDTKLTAVDRYIQRALERQQNQQNLLIDDIESLQETNTIGDTSHVKTSDRASFIPSSRKSISEGNSKRKSDKTVKGSTEKTKEKVIESKQSSPVKQGVTVYSQKVCSGNVSQASYRQAQPLSHEDNQSVKEVHIQEPVPQTQYQLQVKKCQYSSNEDNVPSPKKTLPRPVEKMEKAPQLNESLVSETPAPYRRESQPSSHYISNDPVKKDTTPTRREASYARETLSSQFKKRTALPEEFQGTKVVDLKYQSRGQQQEQYSTNKSLSRSVSNSVLYREGAFKSVKHPEAQDKTRDISCTFTIDNDVSQGQNTMQTIQTVECMEERAPGGRRMKSSTKTYDEMVQKQVSKITKQHLKKNNSKKQKMLNSFGQLNLSLFVELGRVKKPSKYVFQAGRMLCQLVNAFREKPVQSEFLQWERIQAFVTKNVNKFSQEVNAIKPKVLEPATPHNVGQFVQINEEYFNDSNMNTLKNSAANKQLKIIVCFVFNVVQYILSRESTFEGHQEEEPQETDEQCIPSSNVTNDETPRSSKKNLEFEKSPFVLTSLKQTQAISQAPKNNQQAVTKDVSPKPKFLVQGIHNGNRPSISQKVASPFRMQVKSKFTTIEPTDQNTTFHQREPSQKKTPNRGKVLQDRSNNRVKEQPSMIEKQESPVKKQLIQACSMGTLKPKKTNHITSPSQNLELRKIDSPGMRKEYSSKKLSQSIQSNKKSVQQQQVVKERESEAKYESGSIQDERFSMQYKSPVFQQQPTEQENDPFNFSPGKLKEAIHQHRNDVSQMIIDKSYQIENNMNMNISPSKKIDIGIIEALKKRRQANQERLTGVDLEMKREAIIMDIQRNMLGLE